MDESGFPAWWNVKAPDSLSGQKRKKTLDSLRVSRTYDLVLALVASAESQATEEAPETVSVSVRNLFAFCNSKLLGMRMDLRQACKEDGVQVTGASKQKRLTVTRPGLVACAAVDDPEWNDYGWDGPSLDSFPPECYCPITMEPFQEPVLLVADGYTYERDAIQAWLRTKATSPMTGELLPTKIVATNRAIKDWMQRLVA